LLADHGSGSRLSPHVQRVHSHFRRVLDLRLLRRSLPTSGHRISRQLLLDQRDEICFRGGDRIAREEQSARTSFCGPSPIGAHSRVEVVPMTQMFESGERLNLLHSSAKT
jgi:hypothetical protein